MSEPPPALARSRTLLGMGALRGGADYRKAARFCAWLVSAILLVCFWQWYTAKVRCVARDLSRVPSKFGNRCGSI